MRAIEREEEEEEEEDSLKTWQGHHPVPQTTSKIYIKKKNHKKWFVVLPTERTKDQGQRFCGINTLFLRKPPPWNSCSLNTHTIMVHSVSQEANNLCMNMNHMLGYTVWLWGLVIIPNHWQHVVLSQTPEEKSAGLFSIFREILTQSTPGGGLGKPLTWPNSFFVSFFLN